MEYRLARFIQPERAKRVVAVVAGRVLWKGPVKMRGPGMRYAGEGKFFSRGMVLSGD